MSEALTPEQIGRVMAMTHCLLSPANREAVQALWDAYTTTTARLADVERENARLSAMVEFARPVMAMLSEDAPRCQLGAALYLEWAEHEGNCRDCAAIAAPKGGAA